MAVEPAQKRTVAFFDGQNLFHMAKKCFGYVWPNFDPHTLAEQVCKTRGWTLIQVRFYTGLPSERTDPRRGFWLNKLAALGRKGAFIYHRDTRHGQEKGIDIRIALDVVGGALRNEFDVAVVFSQDADFSEVADEIRWIAGDQDRWIKIACAFPDSGAKTSKGRSGSRGIPGTDWIRISAAEYADCLDPVDHRPRPAPKGQAESEGSSRAAFRKRP